MSAPPEPCVPHDPCKGLIGQVNRLEAIDNQVSSADNMVASMINEVMGTVDHGIDQFSGGTLGRAEISGAEVCNATTGCFWEVTGFCIEAIC